MKGGLTSGLILLFIVWICIVGVSEINHYLMIEREKKMIIIKLLNDIRTIIHDARK